MLLTLSSLLPRINPHLVWAHFAHSEGGLIANTAFTFCEQNKYHRSGIPKKASQFIKKNLVTATYGAVKPIPNDHVLFAVNTYTDKDVVLSLCKNYLDRDLSQTTEKTFTSVKNYRGMTYTVKVVETKLVTDSFLNIEFPSPGLQSIEQALNMGFFEHLAYRETQEGAPHLNQQTLNFINGTAFSIKDHGFSEATYQKELGRNIDALRQEYGIYDEKNYY